MHGYIVQMTIAPARSETSSAHITNMGDDLLALLKQADPDVSRILASERDRQETTLELIASENHVSNAVMHAAGSWMTN